VDDLTAAVIANGLVLAAEEASIVVVKAAFSTFIVEGSDAAAAVIDDRGQLVAQSAATSLAHAYSLKACAQALLEDHPAPTMEAGDVYVMNDSYRGGIHANDIVVFQPVFVDGAARWFTGTLIHVADVGGSSAGGMHATATDVFQEGVQLPPVRLTDDLLQILALNSRSPDEMLGDIEALVAGTTAGCRRLEALIAEHGPALLAEGIDEHLDHTERLVRQEVAALADGAYAGSYVIDDDGIHTGIPLDVRVTVTVDGDHATIDFAGTSANVPAAVNSSLSQTISGALFALRCFLDGAIPVNDGMFRPFELRVPQGCLLNPRKPLPTGGRFVAVYAVVDAVWEALSQARDDRAVAASGILTPYTLASTEDAPTPWLHMAFEFGGVGARRGKDGVDGTGIHFGLGRSMVPQVEPVELRCPLRVESLDVIDGSGGAGRWAGGRGTRTTYLLLADAVATFRCDRHANPPPGRDGGEPGRRGGYFVVHPGGEPERLPDKAANVRLRAGDRFVIETSGGGGYGAVPSKIEEEP
jgi:N-methylhydantoinase B